ncbi:NXF1-like protein [Mya arenaria]|uniref:NXF1-like protein n=1 Tax=Mya arenaria TaxID=6604 RepID=A0ABY7FFM2_MYAAR|nr:NXF1-like protein [Mya arenaria]
MAEFRVTTDRDGSRSFNGGGGYGYGGSSYNRGRGGYSGGRGRGDAGIFKRLGLPLDRKTMGDSDWYKVTIPWGKKTEKDFILKSINDHIDVPFVPTYMTILVKPSQPPNIPMGKEEIDKLKVCMSNRYDPATKALNLSCLHTDQELAQSNLFMCLARPQVMSNVVKVIKENIPELVQLDVSNNKLQSLEHLGGLVPSTPDMKVLNLANNKINMLEELRKVQKWKIDWLTLDGNPLCDKFNDHTAYVSGVRRLFPKVLKLDTTDLPPPITFDIEARTDLPKSKIISWSTTLMIEQDWRERTMRQPCFHCPHLITQLFKTTRKFKTLKNGNKIVAQLCLLPKTQHDPNSFVVDCNFATAQMISFNIQGVFKEVDKKSDKPPMRAFSRTFVTVASGSGMVIVNDVLTVTNASPDQIQTAFKNPAPTPSSSPIPQTSPTEPFAAAGLTEIQTQMNNWEYAKAGQNFLELQQKGLIPPEAFKTSGHVKMY